DVVCVGAEPIALLDYLAVERIDEAALEQIARGLKAGAQDAGVEIPGGELAVLPELIRGHPSPTGFDLCGTCVGTVALDPHITGDGLLNLLRLGDSSSGFSIEDPLPVPGICRLFAQAGGISPAEAYAVFNLRCGFDVVVDGARAQEALEIVGARHPGAARIG